MNHKSENVVVGVCSPSGGGKTSLVKKLSELIEDSVTICFDDYGDPFWDIVNFEKWILNGADLNTIETLRSGSSITSPKKQEIIKPKKNLV